MKDEMKKLAKCALRQLEIDESLGIDRCPRADVKAAIPTAAACEKTEKRSKADQLAALEGELGNCCRCGLGATRTKLVFGSGDCAARLMIIGEAPGAEEDRQGLPFVGRSGKLLTKMLAFINLKREEVYIANVLKCRPPGNRDPLPSEIKTCIGTLVRQIEIIEPAAILALGRFAAQTLLETDAPIKALRGKVHDYLGVPFVVTFHPAYLLRNPNDNSKAKMDLDRVKGLLEGSTCDGGE